MRIHYWKKLALLAGLSLLAANAAAQTIKIGLVNSTSGVFATLGDQIDKSVKLYMKENAAKLPPGVKVELIVRDDGGPNPDNAKRLTQELIVRDRVQFLTGYIWTPNTMAVAPLLTESKTPLVIMNAAASVITTTSPYLVRASLTLWQSGHEIGRWAAKKYKRAYNMVTAGAPSTAIMKAYGDLGLRQAGIPFIGTGDAVTEEELVNMGDVPLGYISAWNYSNAGDRPANKAYLAAWERDYGKSVPPGFIAVGAWDAMDMIYTAIREQAGKVDPDQTMKVLSNYKNPNSPRGPIAIDPTTRDIVQNIYIREVKKVAGRNMNVEFETIPNVKDPWKELNKKK